jgi:hypothetical protein
MKAELDVTPAPTENYTVPLAEDPPDDNTDRGS